MINVEEEYDLGNEQFIRSNEEKTKATFISVNKQQSDGVETKNDSQTIIDINTHKVNKMQIKTEKVESEDYHDTMVDIQERTEDIKENLIKEEVTEDLTNNGHEKTLDSKSYKDNETRIKIEKVDFGDYHETIVEIQEGTEDIKDNFFKEEVTKDLTNDVYEKTFDSKSYKVSEAKVKTEKVESEYYYDTMVDIKNGTENIKENLFKEEITEDLTNNEHEKTLDSESFKLNETEGEPRIKIEVGETEDYYYMSLLEIVKNNEKLKEQQKTIDTNAYNDNRTRNQANKNTYGCYFESKIETDTNKQTAITYNSEDITKQQFFQCDLCKKMYRTKKQITGHILKTHKNLTDKHCPQKLNTIHCNKVTNTYTNINRPYKCEVCFKQFAKSSYLAKHVLVHTVKKCYSCTVCSKSFSAPSNLKNHERVHTGEKPYKCIVCLKYFSEKSTLKIHERVHTGEKPYSCNVCLKCFSQKSDLTKHERVHTGEKPYQCNVCLKSFAYQNYLRIHKRVHTGEKPYKCDVCSKSFSQKSDITNHNRIHTGEKPYKCNICLKSFCQVSNLTLHKRVHTGEKPHKCDVCFKSFRLKSDITTHKRVHTGEKPHECNLCSKKFARNDRLIAHQRVHTGEKPFKCVICLKSYTKKCILAKHKCRAPLV